MSQLINSNFFYDIPAKASIAWSCRLFGQCPAVKCPAVKVVLQALENLMLVAICAYLYRWSRIVMRKCSLNSKA